MTASQIDLKALTPGGRPLDTVPLSGQLRIALLLQAGAIYSHLDAAGWCLYDRWSAARIDHRGRLRGLTAGPGSPEEWPHRRLSVLLSRFFPGSGKGQAWRTARSLQTRWDQAMVRISADEVVEDLLFEASFLWSSRHGPARSALVASIDGDTGMRIRVAGPARWRRCLRAAASERETPADLILDGRARRCWERAAARPATGGGLGRVRAIPATVGRGRLRAVERSLKGRAEPAAKLVRARCLRELERPRPLRACLRGIAVDALDPEQRLERERLLDWLERSRSREDDRQGSDDALPGPPASFAARRGLDPWQAARRWRSLGRQRRRREDAKGATRAFAHAERLWRRCDASWPRRGALLDLVEMRLRLGLVEGVAESLSGRLLSAADDGTWERRLNRARAAARRLALSAATSPVDPTPTALGSDRSWELIHDYLAHRQPTLERLRQLFCDTGYARVSLVHERESGDRRLVGGAGGAAELSAPLTSGRLVLRAEQLDPLVQTLFVLALRDAQSARFDLGAGEDQPFVGESTEGGGGGGIIGRSPALLAALGRLDRLAPAPLPILIEGASGTGKELAARRVHAGSRRRGRTFVAVNCAALPRGLVSSELFGHVRGAFTGADRERSGVFESARGGTVFLDEIGDLHAVAQGMLLRVLQESEIRRVGETRTRPVDVRIVTATHRDLGEMVDRGSFRRDLFYRLAAGRVSLPPLAQRGADVLLLAESFVAQVVRARGVNSSPGRTRRLRLSQAAQERLSCYSWPGNVRELQNVIAVAVSLADGDRIEPDHLELPDDRALRPRAGSDYHDRVFELRRSLVRDALRAEAGNKARAARRLGLSRQALSYLVRRLGLQVGY